MVNATNLRTAVIRVYSSANRSEEVDADVERVKLAPTDRNDAIKVAAQLTTELQAKLDVRQLLRDLPEDDPDRTVDPGRGDLFWQDIDGERYLVGREGIVTVTWSGTQYIPSWRRA